MSAPVQTWDTEEAACLAREAYRYVKAPRELCRTARREAQRRAA